MTCERCGQPAAHPTRTATGVMICTECLVGFYTQCGGCDGWHHNDDHCPNGCPCGGDDCDSCYAVLDAFVHDYSYQPRPVFHGVGPLFLGPEIEVEVGDGNRYRCAQIAFRELGDLGYLKRDGSLTCGFEIVTHPMSYDWALANFPWDMLGRLRDNGCLATDTTGIHVHLSRAGFSSVAHSYRWMKFIYRNERQVQQVARREASQWAAFCPEDRRAIKNYVKGDWYGPRYRAINTNNEHTFELRVFAGSLDPQTIQAAFAFSVATVEYTRQLSVAAIAGGGWGWPAFTGWLAGQSAYTPLVRQLEALSCAC
ncbi:amidoligase family protein [Actinoplanes awajinensis]|uniref:amidoligase family protein n=1 Tax=Actinoplanes awajinensis TaxID=135946 RepID=UPI000A79DC2A|nr:amidoligase family protein [Actinoplanes awajinensis]